MKNRLINSQSLKSFTQTLFFLGGLFILGLSFSSCSKKPAPQAETNKEAIILSKQDFLKVESSQLLNAIHSTGELKALTESTVNSEVSGNVLKILVEEGQKVSKGQTLALIDSRDLQEQLTQSKEQLRKAIARRD